MKKLSEFTILRAKRTMFGRAVCRLFGDQTGAVMMEYVVIGVLVVAACVAMVMLFGKQIRNQFAVMMDYMRGDTEEGKARVEKIDQDLPDEIETAEGEADSATNQGQSPE